MNTVYKIDGLAYQAAKLGVELRCLKAARVLVETEAFYGWRAVKALLKFWRSDCAPNKRVKLGARTINVPRLKEEMPTKGEIRGVVEHTVAEYEALKQRAVERLAVLPYEDLLKAMRVRSSANLEKRYNSPQLVLPEPIIPGDCERAIATRKLRHAKFVEKWKRMSKERKKIESRWDKRERVVPVKRKKRLTAMDYVKALRKSNAYINEAVTKGITPNTPEAA